MLLEHWMMFSTFAEQDYFVYPRSDVYSGVIINANMAAHAPSGLASFIIGKLHANTKYMVDPITHAFQHDPAFIKNDKGEVKKAIRLLADEFGDPVASRVGSCPLRPAELAPETILSFASKVLAFQRDHLRSYIASSEAAKYLEANEVKAPYVLIAPYFFLTDTNWENWLPVNISCIEASSHALAGGEKLFAEIVVDHGVLLDEKIREAVVRAYRSLQRILSGFIVWVDNFDEQSVPVAELNAFKIFCSELKSIAPEVINLHGGYFSILLGGEVGGSILTGVTHGPEFGEYRSVVPVGGGIPIARYYIPRLHARVRFREAADLFQSAGWLVDTTHFYKNVCDCEECKSTIGELAGNFTSFGEGEVKNVRRGRGMVRIEFPSAATKLRCLRHYLQRKHREYEMVRRADPGVSLKELESSINEYKGLLGSDGIAHLLRWKKVLLRESSRI